MAARFTVYCKKSAATVTPAELLKGTDQADLHTIAEGYDIAEALIVSALGQLRIENVRPPDFLFYRIYYRPPDRRQIDIERWATVEQTKFEVAEVLENLATSHPAATKIREHLAYTVDSVSAAFGSSADEQMAPVIASEVVRWLAQFFDGIILAPDGSWWELGRHHEYRRMA